MMGKQERRGKYGIDSNKSRRVTAKMSIKLNSYDLPHRTEAQLMKLVLGIILPTISLRSIHFTLSHSDCF